MMKKRTILKRAVAGIGVLSLLVGISPVGLVGAHEYGHEFIPPFAGCADKRGPYDATKDPYVSPSGSTLSTTYVLIGRKDDLVIASNHIKTGTKGKISFIYRSGQGGAGTSYRMQYYPSKTDFEKYTVHGNWQP